MLVGFLVQTGKVRSEPAKSGVTSLISLEFVVPAERLPPPPPLPSKLVDEIKDLAKQHAVVSDPESSAMTAAPGTCSTLDLVSKAIASDPSALESVIRAPPETRSVAEAIVMWNAGWSSAALTSDSPLAPARAAVEVKLATVDDACLDEPIAGPRLVPIRVPDSQSTMILVFGSGNWTWRELMIDSAGQENVTLEADEKKHWFDWF